VVLGTHVGLHSFTLLGGCFVNILPCCITPDEGNSLDVGVVADVVHSVVGTLHNIQHSVRKTYFGP